MIIVIVIIILIIGIIMIIMIIIIMMMIIMIIIIIKKVYSCRRDAHLDDYNKRMSSLKERILGDKYRLLLPLIIYCYHCHYIIITLVYIYNYYFCS